MFVILKDVTNNKGSADESNSAIIKGKKQNTNPTSNRVHYPTHFKIKFTLEIITLKYSVPSAKFLAKLPTTASRFLTTCNSLAVTVVHTLLRQKDLQEVSLQY